VEGDTIKALNTISKRMNMKTLAVKTFGVAAAFLAPTIAFAQGSVPVSSAPGAIGILDRVLFVLNTRIVPLVIAVALFYFLMGVYEYIKSPSPIQGEAARTQMVYGLIGLFIMVSVWGLVNLVGATFGISTGGTAIPTPIVNPNNIGN
jgi:hypothetical protein